MATIGIRRGVITIHKVFFLTVIFFCIYCAGKVPVCAEDALSRIDRQCDLYPQERLHVVTDRDMYCAGDTVWLRVFVADASTLRQTSVSKYAYIELRNPFNGVSRRIKIIEREGVYAGYVPLSENLPEGDYTLVAYTMYLENVGRDYFFRKPLRILAPHSSRYTIDAEFTTIGDGEVRGSFRLRSQTGERPVYNIMSWEMPDGKTLEMPDSKKGFTRKFSRAKGETVVLVRFGDYARYIPIDYPVSKTSISFYPEGGWLIAGELCKVAFKAEDEEGRGVSVSGVVRDSSGAEVTRFSTRHNGMGTFGIVPDEGCEYTAEYTGPEGVFRIAEVGSSKPGAAALRYGESGTRIFFSVAGGAGMDLELVVACRGRGVLSSPLSRESSVTVDKETLVTGLYQAMLVSRSDSVVVSERLFFIGADRKSPEVATVSSDSMTIILRAPEGMNADCSLRVVGTHVGCTSQVTDIRTQLLLQSELRGRIEDAGYYFREGDRESHRNLDLLMMVNGWSRYNLPDAILGKYSEPDIALEIGQEICGQVRSRWRNRPLEGVMVCAISPKADFGTYAETDSAGIFRINGFDLPEETPFIFRAMNEKGGNEGNYDIYNDRFPHAESLIPKSDRNRSESEIAEFFRGSRWVMLDEIVVQALKNEDVDIYESLSSYTKNSEDFEQQGITSIEEAIRGVPGITQKGGRLYWRGEPVTYFIDGIIYDPHNERNKLVVNKFGVNRFTGGKRYKEGRSVGLPEIVPLPMISPLVQEGQTPLLKEVELSLPFSVIYKISFLNMGQSLILGNGFEGGVIMITTKNGSQQGLKQQFDLKDYIPLGYQKYKEYASPLLSSEPDAYEIKRSPTLLWVPSVKFGYSGSEIKLNFSLSQDYDIIVEGISSDGIIRDSL